MVVVSFATKNNISSVLVADNGCEKFKKTYRVRKEVADTSFKALLDAMKTAVMYLKPYIEEVDSQEIIFECNNSILIKWFNQGYSRDEYQELFSEVMLLLDELPIRYSFKVNKKPYALLYLSEKYIEKPRINGFDFMEGIEDA